MTRSSRAAAVAAALSLLVGCTPTAPDRNNPVITLVVPPDRPEAAIVDVSGLGPSALAALQAPDVAAQTVRVEVLPAGSDLPRPDDPQVAGRSVVVDGIVRFTPSFPFDPGARYRVVVETGRLPGGPPGATTAIVGRPARVVDAARTMVTAVAPSGAVFPENLLRLYVHFSAPMGRRGGGGHVWLLDAEGREVADPFLPVEAELWNSDRTRYTLFLDPGRVKTGIRPNDEMGRALIRGRRYTLVIDADWQDAYGRPLAEPFRRAFRVGPAIETALDPRRWTVAPPRAGSRDPLVVAFPHALDQGLLARALAVETAGGAAVAGSADVAAGETTWRFVPDAGWTAGAHRLVVLGILEDPSGNRIGRAFELGAGQTEREVDRTAVPFMIGP